jgi:hypothetical protein
MAEHRNDTLWQQGFILNKSSSDKLGLLHPYAKDETIVVLVSHDCDLLEDSETDPNCEVIIGRRIVAIDGLYANAKNPRRLHLRFSGGTEQILVELFAANKRFVKKDEILSEPIVEGVRLTQDEHFTLQSWLAARYHRPIFPDDFDRRLKARPSEIHKKIANTIKGTGTDIAAILFDVDLGEDLHHDADDPYSLEILLVYNVSEDPSRALETAKKAASLIRGLFRQYYFSNGKWKNIELRDCLAVSADAISLHRFRCAKPWHFDYLEILAES